jgi:hypothetical protein
LYFDGMAEAALKGIRGIAAFPRCGNIAVLCHSERSEESLFAFFSYT